MQDKDKVFQVFLVLRDLKPVKFIYWKLKFLQIFRIDKFRHISRNLLIGRSRVDSPLAALLILMAVLVRVEA